MTLLLLLMLLVSSNTNDLYVPLSSGTSELVLPKETRHNDALFSPKELKTDAFNINVPSAGTSAYTPIKLPLKPLVGGGSSTSDVSTRFVQTEVPVKNESVALMAAKGDDHDPHAGYECPNCHHKSSHFKHEDGKWYCASCGAKHGPCEDYNPDPTPDPTPGTPIGNGWAVLIILSLFYILYLNVKGEAKEENM